MTTTMQGERNIMLQLRRPSGENEEPTRMRLIAPEFLLDPVVAPAFETTHLASAS